MINDNPRMKNKPTRTSNTTRFVANRRGFTLVELLVAIGIIMVLIGILLPALGKVAAKAKATATTATMNEFGKACDVFYTQFGYYPGIVPETYLASTPNSPLSGTENALLHLMGGAIRDDDPNYAADSGSPLTFLGPTGSIPVSISIKVSPINIGRGPRVEGKQYDPFFTPKDSQLKVALGQIGQTIALPDLLDGWGQPIGYVRAARPSGMLTRALTSDNPQFYIEPLLPYFNSTALGEFALDQTANSVFSSGTLAQKNDYFAQLIRHPAMGSFATITDARAGTARGKFFLFSPGSDGIFFAKTGDGPLQPGTLVLPIAGGSAALKPAVVTTYNDIVVSGGG